MGGVVFLIRERFVYDLWSLLGTIIVGLLVYSGFLYLIDGKYLKAELGGLFRSLLQRA
jgi:hypothetical protein